MDSSLTRIIDANLNRAREGLRVCEDITRFAVGSVPLSKAIKGIRHRIGILARSRKFGAVLLNEARDSQGDAGRLSRRRSEFLRRDVVDVFAANIERAKESLRVLEEISKINDGDLAKKFCALRFGVYDIEKKAVGKIAVLRGVK